MNKQETKFLVLTLVELSDITKHTIKELSNISQRLDVLHKCLTNFIIQKGAPNVKDHSNFDPRGN